MMTPQTTTLTVVPASTKAGEQTIRALLALTSSTDSANKISIKINAIYRDPFRAPAEFSSRTNFSANKGNVGDRSTLNFKDSDVVFYIPPPTYNGTDTAEWAALTANNVKAALKDAFGKVKRLVLFSSIGAQHENGIGIIKLNHITDKILTGEDVDIPQKVVIRPGYFMDGFASWLKQARGTGTISAWLTPLDYGAPVVSLKDIAATCAREILKSFASGSGAGTEVVEKQSPRYINIFGPRHYSSLDLQAAISTVLDNKEIKLNPIPPENLAEYFGHVIPAQYVLEFVEMTLAVLPGGVGAGDFGYEDVDENHVVVRGDTELLDGIRAVYEGMLQKEKKEKDAGD